MSDPVFYALVIYWALLLSVDAVRTVRYVRRPSRDLPCDLDDGRQAWTGAASGGECSPQQS